ncbi:hypothetical protein [Actinomycetospora soli]|uniref:hypothetical protein n=1 Tax=Actinomycetospora soli TaxID=2893887 RepID=UPI001E5051BA|nr:hypothetical protein [Actinomycetospora soli]MCD2187867.1 hypothetical protein [Actinomycetospora soli]
MKILIPAGTFGRIVLFALVLGFVAGLVVSCQGLENPTDVAAIARVHTELRVTTVPSYAPPSPSSGMEDHLATS